MRRLLSVILMVVVTAWANVALAQGSPAVFSGRLIDPNGLVIEGLDLQNVMVTMKSVASGQVYTSPVRRTGDFTMSVPAGDYDLTVPVTGAMYRAFELKRVSVAPTGLKMDLPLPWSVNLGTIGDDPTMLSNDLRARSKFVDGPPPRRADGKPDLSGIWYDVPQNTPRPTPAMNPWALDIQAQMKKIHEAAPGGPEAQAPQAYCLPLHATPTATPFPYKFIQTPTLMVQLTEFLAEGWRQIFMDGRPHPPADEWNPSWFGHSIGRWDGDTLVVDTVGFNESTPGYGVHTEKLHVVERITRPSVGKLVVEITAEDPDAWTAPYKWRFEAGLVTDEEVREFMCQENNKDALHFGGLGWRARP